MDNLPEQIVKRIEEDANKRYSLPHFPYTRGGDASTAFIAGATSEATRAMILLEALERVASGLFHMTPQSAKDLITSYNNQQTK